MPSRKIEKDFVMSDSSINVYGMRLMTSGYLMEEFAKNPIGYYGHDKADGVLLKWEDVRIEGDNVIGKPVINMAHPRAERCVSEIEGGFLNAASMGKLVILDAELEDNPEDANNPILRVTKWYNKECSLVDNPGNRNAMKVELTDGEDNELNLEDLVGTNSIYKNSKTNNNMKKVTLELTPELLGMLNLSDDKATAEAVADGITALHEENKTLTTDNDSLTKAKEKAEQDLADERKTAAANRVSAILQKGLDEKKYDAATKDKLAKTFAAMPDELEDLVKGMQPYQSIVEKLKGADGEGNDDLKWNGKTWEQLDLEDGQLDALKKADQPLFKKMYEAKFGTEYKG